LPDITTAFVLAALVLTVAALASGVVERAPLSFPIIFLGLGFLLGEQGFHIISVGPHDKTLEIVATLDLALVLFIDALQLKLDEVGHDWMVPALTLGPGTILTILLVAVGAFTLIDRSLTH
jgi:NhaP-type Na+/H+ or K+/H+ antiporter